VAQDAGRDPRRARELIQSPGRELDLCAAEPAWNHASVGAIEDLRRDLLELEKR
jgi:hypothetical protein